MRTRTRNKRTRDRRDKKGAAGAPRKNRSNSESESEVTSKQLKSAAKIHQMRSRQARSTDEAMRAPIAGDINQWLAEPNRYDLPGVDYPGKSLDKAMEELDRQQTQKKQKKEKPGKANPFKDSRTAKQHIEPILEAYKKTLGIKGKVRLSAVNEGHPAEPRR